MERFLQDTRYAIRSLLRQPGFAATAILTLALGIGATTGIFSAIDGIVLRPLPAIRSEITSERLLPPRALSGSRDGREG